MKNFCRYIILPLLIVFILSISAFAACKQCEECECPYSSKIELFKEYPNIYQDKVYGAWMGKLIGLIAGQPVEGWPKPFIEERARDAGIYPLNGYIASHFDSPARNFLKGNFNASPPNDDSDLMLAAFFALRKNGIDLTSKNIAEAWLEYVSGACTAEMVALENFRKGVWPPESASTDNPYEEWIGAQMRVDLWGMIAPSMPKKAADFAELDARISHTGNGIYGARFIAAAISIAMVEKDPMKILTGALKTIPSDCRYAKAVKDTIKWHGENKNWEDTWTLIDDKYGKFDDGSRFRDFPEEKYKQGAYKNWNDMKWVYADVNGAAVTLALLYGDNDLTKSLAISVMSGFDCDCNAGTVGAIFGAMYGANAIPSRWKMPLNDTYISGLKVTDRNFKISELAKEAAGYGLKVMESKPFGKCSCRGTN